MEYLSVRLIRCRVISVILILCYLNHNAGHKKGYILSAMRVEYDGLELGARVIHIQLQRPLTLYRLSLLGITLLQVWNYAQKNSDGWVLRLFVRYTTTSRSAGRQLALYLV